MSYATSSDQSAMMAQQPSPANISAVPDLVKIGQIPTNTAIDIETDILDPVVHNDTFCRFQFQNKGILHSNSKLILRLNPSAVEAFLPAGTGIYSLIQRCSLRVGTKTISEIDDFNHYIGYKSMFLANEHQKQREQFTTGRQMAHKAYYQECSSGDQDFHGSVDFNTTRAKQVGIDNGMMVTTDSESSDSDLKTRVFLRTGEGDFGPECALSLQDLFPFLGQNQLPLFMMKEPVTIELFFSKAIDERMCLDSSASNTKGTSSFGIDTSATQLVADYQYFPQEMMEEYARQNKNLSFTYADYRLAKRTIPINASGAEAKASYIINIGGAGRLVSKIFTTLSDDHITSDSVLNNYHSIAMDRLYTGTEADRFNGVLTTNIKYNDHFLYPVDVDNSAQQFHYVTSGEGMVPFINREEYNNEGQGLADATFMGYTHKNQHHGFAGQFFYQTYKLNRNERVNSRGIEIYNTYDKLKNSKGAGTNSATLRSYLEIIRVAQLNDGVMDTFFA
jgi:hypothetical protein